jgi:2-dehydro-3-deoxygluconokinase
LVDVVALGECMLEVGMLGSNRAVLGYAGDTFNTAVYLRRLGRSAAYGTALGSGDPFSEGILGLMRDEGIDASLVKQVAGRIPGAYAIDRDPTGEHRFFYWRSESPAREYMALADWPALRKAVTEAKLVCISGIGLAIIGEAGRGALGDLLAAAKDAGVAVALDPNHRPPLWASPDQARAAIEAVIPFCRYVLAGVADLKELYAGEAWASAWAEQGVEVVLRAEDHAVTVYVDHQTLKFAPEPPVRALDTTGAGDAFNAGYLYARLDGRDLGDAVHLARRLGNFVVQHIGAIIPRTAMPPDRR